MDTEERYLENLKLKRPEMESNGWINQEITYKFNSLGYRGNEHCSDPEISVFGSSFSFGVGIEFDHCWHQQLGNYRVNCYSPAGFLVTNNAIIDQYQHAKISTGIIILQ